MACPTCTWWETNAYPGCGARQAASRGHLTCLSHLHKTGYTWNWQTPHHAIQCGHLACLKYALANGCPSLFWLDFGLVNPTPEMVACVRYVQDAGFDLPFCQCTMLFDGCAGSGRLEHGVFTSPCIRCAPWRNAKQDLVPMLLSLNVPADVIGVVCLFVCEELSDSST